MSELKLINIFNYPTDIYPFREYICDLIGEEDLELLHEKFDYFLLEREKDQNTKFHKSFYSNYKNSKFEKLYKNFITGFITETIGESVISQAKPTFRVHMHNNLGVGEFHKDSDYDHPIEEINILVPVTDAKDTSTVWMESLPGEKDYSPIELKYGECLIFKGSLLRHGNKINTTEKTRVSFDFRVIPLSQYKPSSSGSINTGLKFKIGEYYDFLKKEQNSLI